MEKDEARDDHERFRELCALTQLNSLSVREQLDLENHLQTCASCRQAYEEYCAIGGAGMAFLSARDAAPEEAQRWDNRAARERLFAAIRRPVPQRVLSIEAGRLRHPWSLPPLSRGRGMAFASLAACVLVALTLGAYRIGERRIIATPPMSADLRAPRNVLPVQASDDSQATQNAQLSNLEKQISGQEIEIAKLRAASIAADERANELGTASGEKEAALQQITAARDQLAKRLAENEKAYEILQADYETLRTEHGRSILHTASVEAELTDLRTTKDEQEHRLKDDEQFLTSDRDIRELMGARKLYIADVFDVDSGSHTRKPFGRVFYTQNKSLVFYAFDLDHQPGVKNANVFQVWGQRDAEANGSTHAMNLGILYMDSETNRRWVLRSDDPKQLDEIDAVFVTVEPHGGSQKPTGKPLLYALLRKEANHP
jgi:anti-sigma-K factor RskA